MDTKISTPAAVDPDLTASTDGPRAESDYETRIIELEETLLLRTQALEQAQGTAATYRQLALDRGKEISARTQERDEARDEAVRLLTHCAPDCQPLPTVAGIVTQLDTYIAGLEARLALLVQQGAPAQCPHGHPERNETCGPECVPGSPQSAGAETATKEEA